LRYLPSEVDDYVIQRLAEVALLQRGCTNDRAVGLLIELLQRLGNEILRKTGNHEPGVAD
jgi:hypothetical protein